VSETGRLPYPGLRAYERDESDLFFGREGCVDEMVDRLAATRFLAVLGASGSGKSSLVRTGLLDALEIGLHATAGPLWIVADCHPGGSAFRNLAEALLTATQNTSPGSDAIDTLDTFLRRGPRAIIEWANDGNLPAKHNLLVLVDQFEELFRYGDYAGREEAEAFAALLLESIRTPGRIHVVITMRSEYLGGCALIPGLAEQINSSLYLTRRMTREECREAIEGPAAVIGFSIEPALVSHILNDMAALAPWEQDRENSQLQRLSRQADQPPATVGRPDPDAAGLSRHRHVARGARSACERSGWPPERDGEAVGAPGVSGSDCRHRPLGRRAQANATGRPDGGSQRGYRRRLRCRGRVPGTGLQFSSPVRWPGVV
jgi:hypothetical protein